MSTHEPTRRVVLLGASNLTRGYSIVVETCQQMFGEPLDFMSAMGHGRSYGQESCVLGRKISGIFSCRLWDDLARRRPLPTVALLTDVGNDIVFGVPVSKIMDWVEGCLDALLSCEARVVVTELPLGSLRTLGSVRFRMLRALFFPFSRLSLDVMLATAEELNRQLIAACADREISIFPVKTAWFGFDPIHIRRRNWTSTWPQIVSAWVDDDQPRVVPRGSLRRWFYLQTRVPRERSIWTIRQAREQPSGRLKEGTLVSTY